MEIKTRIVTDKVAFIKKKIIFCYVVDILRVEHSEMYFGKDEQGFDGGFINVDIVKN